MTDRVETPPLDEKESRLQQAISYAAGDGPVLIGFSGGVDSSLLLWESVKTLGADRVIAVTAVSPTSVDGELEDAHQFAARLAVKHVIVQSDEFEDPDFVANDRHRCYICKRIRYRAIRKLAREYGLATVFDGTQADDDPEQRPGMQALEELSIRRPLAEAGIGKPDVRRLLYRAGHDAVADKPAQPCLATRIPVGVALTREALERVRLGEHVLRNTGLKVVRLRDHHPIGRIVTDREGMSLLMRHETIRRQVHHELRNTGYDHVVVDLCEYGDQDCKG